MKVPSTPGFLSWDVWLAVVAAGTAVAGFLLAAFPSSAPVDALVNRYADAVFWPDTSPAPALSAYRGWVFGVTGAVMGGWGLLMCAVVRGPFRRREPWAWPALVGPLACWYLADTTASLAHHVTSNAVLNTALLALFAVPLLGTASEFLHRPPGGSSHDP